MQDHLIICPHCQKRIPLNEAISHQIKDKLKKEFEVESKRKESELVQKEEALYKKEKELENSKNSLNEKVAEKIKIEKEKLEIKARQKANEAFTLELKDLREEIEEKGKKLFEAQRKELELRKERRELEESKKAFELKIVRKMDEEREKIKEDSLKKIMEEHRFKDLEKEKQINDMRRQIENLKRKAEQGSQQTQGEVLELDLENTLNTNFPYDKIEPVPKGIKGADILQKVYNQSGHPCGTIIWEFKRTKTWNDQWIGKLKDDQREIKAEIGVLMSTAMPKEVSNFSYVNGIWVTDYSSSIGLATALRINLIQVANTKLAAVGKNEKMEVLYNYLSGSEFRQKVEGIVETFDSMKRDLDQEKRAMVRMWSKKEKQMERVINNISGMYGDMQGIIGASLPQIKALELKTLSAESEIDKSNEENHLGKNNK